MWWRFDFSFSGIKTAVLRYVRAQGMEAGCERRRVALAGFAGSPGEALEQFGRRFLMRRCWG